MDEFEGPVEGAGGREGVGEGEGSEEEEEEGRGGGEEEGEGAEGAGGGVTSAVPRREGSREIPHDSSE